MRPAKPRWRDEPPTSSGVGCWDVFLAIIIVLAGAGILTGVARALRAH